MRMFKTRNMPEYVFVRLATYAARAKLNKEQAVNRLLSIALAFEEIASDKERDRVWRRVEQWFTE